MAEIRNVLRDQKIRYEGLFNLKELYKLIDTWFQQRGYDKQELKNYEDVSEKEKQIVLELMPYKKITDYARIEIRIYAIFSNLVEVEVEKDGLKMKLTKGKVDFTFDTFLVTDYENKWETTAFYYFLRTIFDKFVYKIYTNQYEKEAIGDCKGIQDEIKSFLNLNRY